MDFALLDFAISIGQVVMSTVSISTVGMSLAPITTAARLSAAFRALSLLKNVVATGGNIPLIRSDYERLLAALQPLKNTGWKIDPHTAPLLHKETLLNPFDYGQSSGWAKLIGLSDLTLTVFNGDFTKTATFNANSDHSWIATDGGVVRQRYGHALDVEAPDSAWHPYENRAVTLYTDAAFEGRGWSFEVGRWDLRAHGAADTISSLIVSEGYRVTLYEHPGFTGQSRVFQDRYNRYIGDLNDKISSLVVERRPAVLFGGAGFCGPAKGLDEGNYTITGSSKRSNDKDKIYLGFGVTSVWVSPGYQVTLYENKDFSGRSKVLTGDADNIGDDLDDNVSAVIVERVDSTAPVVLYQHQGFVGKRQRLRVGRHDVSQLSSIGNDAVTSLCVAKGHRVTLFENSGFTGRFKCFTGDVPFVGSDFNDTVSSLIIEKLEDAVPLSPVVLFQHQNFGGNSQRLEVGEYDVRQLSIGNDVVTSLRVLPGYEVTLYENAGFSGNSRTYSADTAYIGSDFNDKTSSVIVRRAQAAKPPVIPAELFSDTNFGGRKQTLAVGRYDHHQLSIGNDTVSSLRVAPGYRVTLYEHGGFTGRTKAFTGDASFVGGDFNDTTSGVVVEKL
ncbi:beta/gamma crystallin-related protein [Paraliomyxa miuraensis]|uniref:beta/gamma crystallin-related protein n=1 Tax=Paraliomyxa miuraensis TaxID=376150 RepID=UPI002256751F|nr:beta/gamma crystallin-related protein [Paraliomyxa miuraensis]MCX4241083.1 beta/gamma crystallin-related protein [Paraliomyxa miuraensis]